MTTALDGGRLGEARPGLPRPGSVSNEREAKLVAPLDLQLPSLDGLLKGAMAVSLPVRHLDATYYDTADLRLARWQITLRYRTGEPGLPWTLKLPEGEITSGLVRREVNFSGEPETIPPGARDLVRAYVRSSPLLPVAQLITSRQPTEIRARDGRRLGEIVSDFVEVHHGGKRTDTFREIEIEVDAGARKRESRKLLHTAVGMLVEAGCVAAPPVPKLIRALGPSAAEPPDVVLPHVDAKAPVTLFLRWVISASVLELLRRDPGMRMGEDPEDVHRFRVATRKLRSELRTFRPLLEHAAATSLRAELRWLGGEVGRVRDADVLTDRLRSDSQTLPPVDGVADSELLALLADHTRQARDDMLAALRTTRYDQLLDSLVRASNHPPVMLEPPGLAAKPAAAVVTRLARRAWRRLDDAVRVVDDDASDATLHRIRILAKRCRYAAEGVAPVVGHRAAGFAAAIAEVQTVLGDLHDTVVAETWLRQAAEAKPSTGIAAGQLVARLLDRRSQLRAAWRRTWKRSSTPKLRSWL